MPFTFITIGILLIIAGAKGSYGELKNLLIEDFTGPRSFLYWIVALMCVGVIGYAPPFAKMSRALIALIILAMVLATRGGLLTKINEAIASIKPSDNGANSPGAADMGENNPFGENFNPMRKYTEPLANGVRGLFGLPPVGGVAQ